MSGLALYRGLTGIAAPIIGLYLRRRLAQGKEHPLRFSERHGIASQPRPNGPLLWLHAASIGEAQSALSLVRRILASDDHLNILLTTGTITSAELMEARLPIRSLHQFVPVDRLPWVRRFLDHWQPDLALWMESEFWPNLVIETQRRGVPAMLVNGRMSERSYTSWLRAPGVIRTMLCGFTLCFAQTESEAERLTALGARDVKYRGNLKYSAAPLPFDEDELANLRAALGDRPVWLAASTHPGEESLAADVHIGLRETLPGLLTIVVPRHPRRGAEVAQDFAERGLTTSRRSEVKEIRVEEDIHIADTLGDLGLYYRLSNVVFIGGSMGGHGGHNPLEAAQLDCAIIHGPDMANFSTVAEQLAAGYGAVHIFDAHTLSRAVHRLLTDNAERRRQISAAKEVARANSQVVDSIFDDLASHISAICGQY
jgi:3-deoxy-D-manno-octulosonic-acid transferase